MIAGLASIVWVLLVIGGPLLGIWLAVRLFKRRKSYRPGVLAVGWFTAFAAASGTIGTVVGLVMAFGAVGGESIDPSQKARVLGEGIALAMNCSAWGLMLFVPSAVILRLLLRKEKTEKEQGAAGD